VEALGFIAVTILYVVAMPRGEVKLYIAVAKIG
jgi:hypothetical protein